MLPHPEQSAHRPTAQPRAHPTPPEPALPQSQVSHLQAPLTQKKALLCGYYGMGNAGDEALMVALIQMLPAHITPIVLSKHPQQTRDRYGVEAFDRWQGRELWQAFQQADIFIWGGGSLMQDTSSALSPLYYAGLMKLAQLQGLTTIAWAQGLGPLKKSYNRWITRHVLTHCDAVTVRDRASADLLDRWQIPYQLAPDPVWALTGLASAEQTLADLPRPWIAVNLRQHRTLSPIDINTLGQALQQLQEKTQGSLFFLPFQASLDLAIAQQLQPNIVNSRILQIEDPQILKGLFRTMDLAIAMRLHAVIMATSEGCRCFALSYDPKVSQVRQTLELAGWELTEAALPNADTLCDQWLTQLHQTQGLAADRSQDLIQAALQHRDLLERVLKR
jgi:polysaccharide pyruvyl transferase CsaB